MDREHELWVIALWVEKQHGDEGMKFIAERIAQLQSEGAEGGVLLWLSVVDRYAPLRLPGIAME